MTIKLLLSLTLLASACTYGDNAIETKPDAGTAFDEVQPAIDTTNGIVHVVGPRETYPDRASELNRGDLVQHCPDASLVACTKPHTSMPGTNPTK